MCHHDIIPTTKSRGFEGRELENRPGFDKRRHSYTTRFPLRTPFARTILLIVCHLRILNINEKAPAQSHNRNDDSRSVFVHNNVHSLLAPNIIVYHYANESSSKVVSTPHRVVLPAHIIEDRYTLRSGPVELE